jgi:hypothetical protein
VSIQNAQRTSSSDNSQRATHLNQFQETLGTRKNQFPDKWVKEHVLKADGRRRSGKDLLREEQVNSGVVEHVLEAGGRQRAGKTSAGKNGLFFFPFDVLDFSRNSGRLTYFYTNFCAKFKSTQSTQKHVKRRLKRLRRREKALEVVRNTCVRELKNVPFDKYFAGLVLYVGPNFFSITSRQKSSEKMKKRTISLF